MLSVRYILLTSDIEVLLLLMSSLRFLLVNSLILLTTVLVSLTLWVGWGMHRNSSV